MPSPPGNQVHQGANPVIAPNYYCGGGYIQPDCVMLRRSAVRSLLAKVGLLDALYKYDCEGLRRKPCQAGLPLRSSKSEEGRLHRLAT